MHKDFSFAMIELIPFVTVEVIQGTSRNGHMVIQMCHNEDRGENGTNGSHFPVFSKDIAFAHHFGATHSPPTLPPYRSASGIGYATKKPLKWWENQLASLCTVDTMNYFE